MEMEKSANLDDLCRLCGELGPQIIPVFGDEGRSLCLQAKIEQNIRVSVTQHDDLPKGICSNCNESLCNICNFVQKCQETQEKLQEFLAIQQSLWLVESQSRDVEGSAEDSFEYEESINHTIDIPTFDSKDGLLPGPAPVPVPDTYTCIVTKGDDGLLEKDITQCLEMPNLLQEQREDGNALLRLPTSTASSGSTPNLVFVKREEGVSTMPCIISVESQSAVVAEPQAPPAVTAAPPTPSPKPMSLAGALKGQPLAASGVKLIRQIHTVDSSSPDGNGRKKVVLVVSKPPNVEIPSVLSAVLQSKSLPSAPRRVATVTTGELVSRKKRLSESSTPMEVDVGAIKEEIASQEEDENILTLQDPKTSGTVHIRLKKQPEQVAIIDPDEEDSQSQDDYIDEETLDYPDDDELYDGGSGEEEEEDEQVEDAPGGDTARRENMRRQMVRRAHLAREKAKRRSERAKNKRAEVKKVREDEKVKAALAKMEEMLKQRDSEDLTVRNKPLPPEFRKIKRMLARKGMLPEKAMKKKRIDMPYKDKVAEHINKLSPTQFQCKLCLETFRWNYKCEQHILNHTGERPFKCHICGKSYKENCVLDQHMRMHKDKYLFVCEECGAGFKRRYLLSYHTRRFHGEEVRLLCEDCGKVFHSRETLSAHVRYHHKKRMVVCDVCGQVVRHSEMARHRRKHGPLTSCPLCNRQFRRQDARERHIQEHDNPTLPAHCIACGKYFRGRRSLMEHLDRVHKMETEGGVVIPKTEPEGDSMGVPEDDEEEEDEEDSRTSHTEEVQLEVHDYLDTDDVGATQQISIGEEEETKTASLVLDEIAATVFVQQ